MAKKLHQDAESLKLAFIVGFALICLSALVVYVITDPNVYQSKLNIGSITTKVNVPSSAVANEIGVAILSEDAGTPMIDSSKLLKTYISAFSAQTRRDMVVVDTSEIILADTVTYNIGTTFSEDKNNEVGETIKDGVTRTFIEQGADYPDGIEQTVVAIIDNSGTIRGAVVVSHPLL